MVQGLRKAYEVMIGHSFEEMLQEADSADLLVEGGSPTAVAKEQKQSRAVQTAEMTLLRRPVVFTLAIVWDSPQARKPSKLGVIKTQGYLHRLSHCCQ